MNTGMSSISGLPSSYESNMLPPAPNVEVIKMETKPIGVDTASVNQNMEFQVPTGDNQGVMRRSTPQIVGDCVITATAVTAIEYDQGGAGGVGAPTSSAEAGQLLVRPIALHFLGAVRSWQSLVRTRQCTIGNSVVYRQNEAWLPEAMSNVSPQQRNKWQDMVECNSSHLRGSALDNTGDILKGAICKFRYGGIQLSGNTITGQQFQLDLTAGITAPFSFGTRCGIIQNENQNAPLFTFTTYVHRIEWTSQNTLFHFIKDSAPIPLTISTDTATTITKPYNGTSVTGKTGLITTRPFKQTYTPAGQSWLLKNVRLQYEIESVGRLYEQMQIQLNIQNNKSYVIPFNLAVILNVNQQGNVITAGQQQSFTTTARAQSINLVCLVILAERVSLRTAGENRLANGTTDPDPLGAFFTLQGLSYAQIKMDQRVKMMQPFILDRRKRIWEEWARAFQVTPNNPHFNLDNLSLDQVVKTNVFLALNLAKVQEKDFIQQGPGNQLSIEFACTFSDATGGYSVAPVNTTNDVWNSGILEVDYFGHETVSTDPYPVGSGAATATGSTWTSNYILSRYLIYFIDCLFYVLPDGKTMSIS